MREIVADAAPDLGYYSFRDSVIHSHCQDWLLRLELNLTDSEITSEAVKWAISELRWMEEQDLLSSSADGGGDELRIDLARWRVMLIEAGDRMDEAETSSGSEMRDRVGKFIFSDDLKEAVMSAAGGEAGRRMAERIDARLDIPDCVCLTKLISHCLLVSMDQTPSDAVLQSLGSCDGNDWMWLHKYFVRTIFPGSDNGHNSLDWLVAYMTASRGTITKLVLRDIINQLQSFRGGDPPSATYLPLTAVLEYAALSARNIFRRKFLSALGIDALSEALSFICNIYWGDIVVELCWRLDCHLWDPIVLNQGMKQDTGRTLSRTRFKLACHESFGHCLDGGSEDIFSVTSSMQRTHLSNLGNYYLRATSRE